MVFAFQVRGRALKQRTVQNAGPVGTRHRIQLDLVCYCACRWHQRCQLRATETSVRPHFKAALGQATAYP